mgnify:CR=1 FL=1
MPATWSGEDMEPGAMLLVNSFRADETYLFDAATGVDVTCTPLAVPTRTGFDTVGVTCHSEAGDNALAIGRFAASGLFVSPN